MRRYLSLLLLPLFLLVTACSTPLASVRAEAEVTGKGTAGPVTLNLLPVTPTYRIDGWAKVTAQYPELPYLTIDGDYTTNVTLSPTPGSTEYIVDSVLIRVPYPAQQIKGAETLPAGVVRTEVNTPNRAASPALARPPEPPTGMAAMPLPPAGGHYAGGCNEPAVAGIASKNNTCAVPNANAKAVSVSAPKNNTNACAKPVAVAASKPNVNACAKPVAVAASKPNANACGVPVSVSAPNGRKCGDPVYMNVEGKVGGNRPTPGPSYNSCPKKAGAAATCPRGIPAIFQGIADLFSGRIV